MASTDKYGVTPLPVRIELHAYGEVYDVSSGVKNWKELEVVLKRDGNSGVFQEMSLPFEFVFDAYDILADIFKIHQYRAIADIHVYIRRDDWAFSAEQYREPQVYNLDFTSFDKKDTTIEIAVSRVSLQDYIKSKGKVTWDIPVSDIKESKPWLFNRIRLNNKIIFRCQAFGRMLMLGNKRSASIGISDEKSEVSVKDVIYVNTVADSVIFNKNQPIDESLYFATLQSEDMIVRYEIDLTGRLRKGSGGTASLILMRSDGVIVSMYGGNNEWFNNDNISWKASGGFMLNSLQRLCLYIDYSLGDDDFVEIAILELDGTITLHYEATNRPVNIDVVDPKKLLQKLVDNITDTDNTYSSDIEDFNTNDQDMLMIAAAESIRGIQPDNEKTGAQVHASYNSFLSWMNVFGYEQHIDKTSVTFRNRAMSFRDDLTAIELGEEDCADMREYVDDSLLYSGVKIGYERKEIENTNVRYEFNGKHDYSTDLSVTDNVIDLISPYRADCYGIEFLAQEREKESTDNKSDKDIFLVNLREESDYYSVVSGQFGGNRPNETLFNGRLNPRILLLKNLDLIGISVDRLKFTASDSNSDIIIDGTPINGDVEIEDGTGLYDPIIYDLASRNLKNMPAGENRNGVVRFKYRVKSRMETKTLTFEGFIDEIGHYPAWEAETTWKLRKRKRLSSSQEP
ncbi:MAG: hypothetical protein LBG96_16775 [Tannerella sp.]|jgi:hypothetical protein|nr:hypothetical protein [Tannerella sp.]